VHADGVSAALLREAPDHDLLVVGSHPVTRFGGIALGDVAATLAHRCKAPLLIAAPADSVAAFPKRIAVAIDGAGEPGRPLEVAIAIARAHDADLQVVHVPDGDGPAERHELALASARIVARMGTEPVVQTPKGPAADGIVRAARSSGASLLVLGHRGLKGLRALGSVSERVVQAAPCSVLLVPHGS
jgi:nucleotide-binding universal stress UspA family protein